MKHRFCLNLEFCNSAFIVLTLISSLLHAPFAHAADFRLSGKCARWALDETGAATVGYTNDFEVVFAQGNWHSKVCFNGNTNYYEEYAFDGQEIKGAFGQGPLVTADSKKAETNMYWMGFLMTNLVPMTAACETKFVWLAYGSYEFFRRDTSRELLAPWVPRDINGAQCLLYRVTKLSETPGFPKTIELRASKDVWKKWEKLSGRDSRRETCPYPDGFIAGEYKVLATTNFEGTEVPMTVSLDRYAMRHERGERDGRGVRAKIEQYLGVITKIERSDRQDVTPPIPEASGAYIYDYRFEEPGYYDLHLTWKPKSGHWPAIDRPEIPALAAKAKREIELSRKAARQSLLIRRTVGFGAMLVLVSVPFLFVCLRGRNVRKAKTKTN